jgi:hypothetical protein
MPLFMEPEQLADLTLEERQAVRQFVDDLNAAAWRDELEAALGRHRAANLQSRVLLDLQRLGLPCAPMDPALKRGGHDRLQHA